jgi:hypothetical protein
MDDQTRKFYELHFKVQFLEMKAAAFQDLFVSVMSKAYPSDFIPCRPWGSIGDRKNDGYLKSTRTLFQVYAPNEMRMVETVNKIQNDFSEALPYWSEHFDIWVFVHNAHAGLPPDVIAKLLELEKIHEPVKVTHWGFEELLIPFRLLSREALVSLYGSPSKSDEPKRPNRRLPPTSHCLGRDDEIAHIVSVLAKEDGGKIVLYGPPRRGQRYSSSQGTTRTHDSRSLRPASFFSSMRKHGSLSSLSRELGKCSWSSACDEHVGLKRCCSFCSGS